MGAVGWVVELRVWGSLGVGGQECLPLGLSSSAGVGVAEGRLVGAGCVVTVALRALRMAFGARRVHVAPSPRTLDDDTGTVSNVHARRKKDIDGPWDCTVRDCTPMLCMFARCSWLPFRGSPLLLAVVPGSGEFPRLGLRTCTRTFGTPRTWRPAFALDSHGHAVPTGAIIAPGTKEPFVHLLADGTHSDA